MTELPPIRSKLGDRLRLVLLLDACEAADIAPIPIMRLHALAFIANVLGPIWSVGSYEGKILKRKGGPFYPELQRELDHLVGLGLAEISDVRHAEHEGKWRLEGSFALNVSRARPVIENARLFGDERESIAFLRRLAFATVRLDRPLEEIVAFDSTWSDQRTGTGDVIDFSEWQAANYSAFTARFFDQVMPIGVAATRGDKVQLYMRFMERRAHAG